MTKPMIKIHNVETGEVIEREMTAEEIAELAASRAKVEADLALDETKAAHKAALLEKLGITEDEAKLLLS